MITFFYFFLAKKLLYKYTVYKNSEVLEMDELEKAKKVERAELLIRVVTESEHLTERDKDITLFWIRDLLEPLKESFLKTISKENL